MKDCIFCKIAKKEISCDKIYENKNFLVFLDILPVTHGHILIIPKKHIVWMQEADDKTIADIFKLAKKMIKTMKKALKCDYVKVFISGDEIPHFHVHLIPSYLNAKTPEYPRGKYQEGESQKFLKKIISAL